MKKLFITKPHRSAPLKGKVCATILASLLTTASFGQGVGINTTIPDPSAALDIRATDKGILIPKVSLQSTVDNTTVPNPANGLIVYNTNQELLGSAGSLNGEGLYQNIGTPAVPNWESVARFKLPLIRSVNSTQAALSIANYNATSSDNAAIEAISPNGFALRTDGKVMIAGAGQAPKFGKVLTTDNSGRATWEGGVAFGSVGLKTGGPEVLPADNNFYTVPFDVDKYDSHNGFANYPESKFTIPTSGIYHFDVTLSFVSDNAVAAVQIRKISGGNETVLKGATVKGRYTESMDVRLDTGDIILVKINNANSGDTNLTLRSDECHFNGHFVQKIF